MMLAAGLLQDCGSHNAVITVLLVFHHFGLDQLLLVFHYFGLDQNLAIGGGGEFMMFGNGESCLTAGAFGLAPGGLLRNSALCPAVGATGDDGPCFHSLSVFSRWRFSSGLEPGFALR